MRLRDIVNVIDENIDALQHQLLSIPSDPNQLRLDNVFNIRKSVERISGTGVFDLEIIQIKEFETLLLSNTDSIILPKREATELSNSLLALVNRMNVFNSVVIEVLPEQNENSLSIRLPDTRSLAELSDIFSKLDKIFNQLLVNERIKGGATLQNFDTGSEWIEILFNSVKAVYLISTLAYIVIFIKREEIKNQELLEVVRNRKITNDLIERLSEEMLAQSSKLIDDKMSEFIQEAGIDKKDNEYFERYKNCVSILTELIDKGLKFFPSTKSPNDIKSILPDFSKDDIKEMLPEILKIQSSDQEKGPENED